MFYKTELHCHTSEVSNCASENAKDTVDKYVEAGYTTLVLTNHINPGTKYFKNGQNKEGIEYFLEGYYEMLRHAEGRLNVLLGAEVCFNYQGRNDYLLFGADEAFLREHYNIIDYKAKTLHEICQARGYLLIQAHPFRPGMTLMSHEHIDGIEVFNGHKNHHSHNDMADMWANYYGMIKTSGTDHHDAENPATCGILTTSPILTNEQLVATLKTNDYRLIRFEPPERTEPVVKPYVDFYK